MRESQIFCKLPWDYVVFSKLSMPVKQGIDILLFLLSLLLLLLLLLKMLSFEASSKKTTIATEHKLGTLVAHRPPQCLWVVWAPNIKAQGPQGPWNEIKVISSVASNKRMAIATGPILGTLIPLNPSIASGKSWPQISKLNGLRSPEMKSRAIVLPPLAKKTTIPIGPILGTLIPLISSIAFW